MTDGKYSGPNGSTNMSSEQSHHGIGGPGGRMPLSLLDGEPDRAEVLESIADDIEADSVVGCAYLDTEARIQVDRGGYVYVLGLVEVRRG